MKIMCTSTAALLKACMLQFSIEVAPHLEKRFFTAQLPRGNLSNVKDT